MPPKKGKGKASRPKQATLKLAQAVKRVVKRVRERRNARGGAPLATFGHIKPHLTVKNIPDGMVVDCYDVIAKLNCSTDFVCVFNELVNPLNNALFKKVSGYARTFEKFKVDSIELVYQPLCSKIKSGNIGMVVLGDVDAVIPADEVAINNYDSGVVGSVGETIRCHYRSKQEDIFRVISGTLSDPLSFYSSRICLFTSNAATSDNESIAGMVGAKIRMEFKHARGERQGMINLYTTEDQKCTGGSDELTIYQESEETIGWFDWAESGIAQIAGYVTGTNQQNSQSTSSGWWAAALDWVISAVVALPQDEKSETDSFIFSDLQDESAWVAEQCLRHMRQNEAKVSDAERQFLVSYYADKYKKLALANPREGRTTHLEILKQQNQKQFPEKWESISKMEKRWVWRNPKFHKHRKNQVLVANSLGFWSPDGYWAGPNAAGDFSVYIECINPDGTFDVIATFAHNGGGTGAVSELLDNDLFEIPTEHVGCRFGAVMAPTGTEVRNLSSGSSTTLTRFSDATTLTAN